MSNLYAKVFSDIKAPTTIRGKDFIEVYLHYNKNNYNERIRVEMLRFEDGRVVISAWVPTKDGSNEEVRLLEAKGGESNGNVKHIRK